ncbi:MAG: hypothetical protein US70_C0001G0039 [Parcubacteria group bacterium GW2011_GWD2_38_11]|nr:MAG: hypothetical protein US70_C0001G0039 [Parcubacteria group bacterium GW2011_GWD2_38_11]
MKIGIDASRAFIKNRTGIEEYSYQVIKNLRDKLKDRQVVLYVKKTYNLQLTTYNGVVKINDLELPKSWQIKVIKFPRFWTQLGLSLEMILHPVDVLFVPAHTVPAVHPARNATRLFNNSFVWYIRKFFNNKEDWQYSHSVAGGPKNTIVVIHGLEYEFCPNAYSWWDRVYMRGTIKKSCQWAKTIISVSNNTKLDLIKLYKVPDEKIRVIYEGYDSHQSSAISHQETKTSDKSDDRLLMTDDKFLLFVGRIEERKNVGNIIKAFEILKEEYNILHKLVLAGKPGHGYENIKYQITNSKYKESIAELGFVSEEEKWELLKKADVFVFPTLYEGFGIPVLEAQSVGCAVVASNNSSIPEIIAVEARLIAPLQLVNPQDPQDIAQALYKIISDETLKNAIIQKGLENVKRFSWDKCAQEIAEVLLK